MLVTKDNYYARVELMPDGSVIRYDNVSYMVAALSSGYVVSSFKSINDLLEHGYTFRPPSLKELSCGDYIQDESGFKRRVLTAQGVGKFRTYLISHSESFYKSSGHYTVSELADSCYTPLPWVDETVVEMTVAEAAERMGVKGLKIIKG